MCRHIIYTEVLVGGGRCTATTFPQSSLKGGFYSVTKKSKETTISVYRTVPHSKPFVHQAPQDRNCSQPQHNNFKYHSLPAMEPPCATVNGDKEMWFAPQDASWLITEQYWFTLTLLVRPSWDMTKAYFLCEVPLRKIYYLGFALFSLQALTADPPGQEFCMKPSVPVRCRKDRHSSQPVFPSLILWGTICPTQILCGQASSCLLCPLATLIPAVTSPPNYEPHHSLVQTPGTYLMKIPTKA